MRHRLVFTAICVAFSFTGCTDPVVDDACGTCSDGFECVDDACVEPGNVGDACACGDVLDACDVSLDKDGCADGLICIAQVFTGIDGGEWNPVCVHATDRGEGERCNHNRDDECAAGLTCPVGIAECTIVECDDDDDCEGGDVCINDCGSHCGPPALEDARCFFDADEQCGLVHPCAAGLECIEDKCAGVGDVGDPCLCGDVAAACDVAPEQDGCGAGLICVDDVVHGIEGNPEDEPICVHAVDRLEGERCNTNRDDECAVGFTCAFDTATCTVVECVDDDACTGLEVCIKTCGAVCGAPAEAGEACLQLADDGCDFSRSCAQGLTCGADGLCSVAG